MKLAVTTTIGKSRRDCDNNVTEQSLFAVVTMIMQPKWLDNGLPWTPSNVSVLGTMGPPQV
jgi:hypothetical protein